MPLDIDGRMYYRTLEVCAKAGISRATLFRWLKSGIVEKRFKDRRGWGMFTEEDLDRIRTEAKRIEVHYATGEKDDEVRANLRKD